MVIQLPNGGDWVNPDAVLRVQAASSPDEPGVHVVTSDGAQMTVPVQGDATAVNTMRDQIAGHVNHQKHHRP